MFILIDIKCIKSQWIVVFFKLQPLFFFGFLLFLVAVRGDCQTLLEVVFGVWNLEEGFFKVLFWLDQPLVKLFFADIHPYGIFYLPGRSFLFTLYLIFVWISLFLFWLVFGLAFLKAINFFFKRISSFFFLRGIRSYYFRLYTIPINFL